MPYFIAVLALVVVGVGFTFLQSHNNLSEAVPLVAESTPTDNISTLEPQNSDDAESKENEENESEEEEDEDTKNTEPAVADIPTIETVPIVADVTPAPSQTPEAQTTYTNGTYKTQTTYKTPDRDVYTMDVTLTISEDVITTANVSFDAKAMRDGYVKRFSSAYQNQIIGQSLEGINLSRIAGASLTTKALNNALENIKNQAV